MDIFTPKTNRLTISVRRHAQPKKDPETGASLDELSPEGLAQSREIGKQLVVPSEGIVGYHSPKHRAYQTVAEMIEATGVSPATIYPSGLLDTLGVSKEKLTKYLVDENGEKRSYDEVVNAVIRGDFYEEGDESFQAAGDRIIQRVKQAVYHHAGKLTKEYGVQKIGLERRVENISHGPVVDAGFVKILDMEGRPITDVSEFGGAFKPGEGFVVNVDYRPGEHVFDLKKGAVDVTYRDEKPIKSPELSKALLDYAVTETIESIL